MRSFSLRGAAALWVLLCLSACATQRLRPQAVAAGSSASAAKSAPVKVRLTLEAVSPSQPAPQPTVGKAPFQLVVGDLILSKDSLRLTQQGTDRLFYPSPLPVNAIPVDLYADTPYDLSQQLIREMRRAARRDHLTRRLIRDYAPEWKPLLLPQPNLVKRKIATGRRRARATFLAEAQRRIESLLDNARKQEPPEPVCSQPQFIRAFTPQSVVAGARSEHKQQVIFTQETVLPFAPEQHIFGVTITDQGQGAPARYYVCARYSITSGGKFVTIVPTDNECSPLEGYVTVTVPFQQLERSLFVEKLLLAFQKSNLMRLTPENQGLRQKFEQATVRMLELQKESLPLTDSIIGYTIQLQKQLDQLTVSRARLIQNSASLPVRFKNLSADSIRAKQNVLADSVKLLKKQVDAQLAAVSSLARRTKTKGKDVPSPLQLRQAKDALQLAQKQRDAMRMKLDRLQPFTEASENLRRDKQDSAKIADQLAAVLEKNRHNTTQVTAWQTTLDATELALREPKKSTPEKPDSLDKASLLDIKPNKNDPATGTLRNALTDMYLELTRQQTAYLAAPQAGTLDVLSEANVYFPEVTRPHTRFQTNKVEVEVEDGMVLGLKATGQLCEDGQKVVFESRAPIGISSDRDLYQEWQRQRLWLQYPLDRHGPHQAAYVRLTDVLRYYPNLAPQAGDRSPADDVYVVHPGDPLSKRTFTKVATQKILQGRLYTDLAGVSDRNPNGLVQLEVSRKFAFGAPWSKFSPNFQLQALGYFTPFVSINKLEQQNRYLPLERTPQRGIYSVNTIDLVRYTNFRVGGEYNLFGIRLPRFKTDIALDLGLALNRVSIRDSVTRQSRPNTTILRVDSTLNVGSYGLSVKFRVRPDSRYGLVARIGYFRYTLFNDRDNNVFISQQPTATEVRSGSDGHGTFGNFFHRYWYEGVIQYELTGRLKLAENVEYFIRPQLSHLLFQSNRTYFQLQTGFQFDIFGPRREAPAGPSLPVDFSRTPATRVGIETR